MDEYENNYAKRQGEYFNGVPKDERVIMEWHKAVCNHKIAIDKALCREIYYESKDNVDIHYMCMINKIERGGEIGVKLNYYAAETGRSTTTDINIQGLKKGSAARKVIVPHKGNVFVKVDSSSIEPRVLAWMSGEDKLIKMFLNGVDVYEDFGKKIRQPRDKAKVLFLAMMFGNSKDIDKNARYSFISEYEKITGGFGKQGGLWQKALDRVLRDKTLELPSGRHINYRLDDKVGFSQWGEEEYYTIDENKVRAKMWYGRAVNNLIQGTARDVFFWQVSVMYAYLQGKADLCWTVHDDAVFECKESDCDYVKKVLKAVSCKSPPWCNIDGLFYGKVMSGYSFDEVS